MADYYKWYRQDRNNFYLLAINVPVPGKGGHGYTMVITPKIDDGHISPQFLGPQYWSLVKEPSKKTQDELFKTMRRLKLKHNLIDDIFKYHTEIRNG